MSSAFDWLAGQNEPHTPEEVEAANKQATLAVRLQEREEARLFYDVFMTGRGPEMLELLRDSTIEQPLMDVSRVIIQGGQIALSPADWAYFREGQNSLVRHIERQIAIARTPENEEQANG